MNERLIEIDRPAANNVATSAIERGRQQLQPSRDHQFD
jgi:hypothetical protein